MSEEFVSTDERGTAEKLINEAKDLEGQPLEFADDGKPTPEPTDDKPVAKGQGEPGNEGKLPEKPAEDQVVDYMAQAMERAKKELKHKTDLTDKEINDYIYKRFLTAAKEIERRGSSLKVIQDALEGCDPKALVGYVRQMESHPLVQGLRAGKNYREIGAEDEPNPEELTPEAQKIASLEKKIDSMFLTFEQRQKLETEKAQLEKQQEKVKEIDKQLEKEETDLCEKYPQFKTWIEESRETRGAVISPELDEILEKVETDGVNLSYAVKAYFQDHGLTAIKKQAEKETIKRLELKAGQRVESGATGKPIPKEIKFHDESAVAEALVSSAMK